MASSQMWWGFNLLILALLAIDLLLHRKDRKICPKEALGWSLFWVVLALLFNVYVYWQFGAEGAVNFFTAYLVEKSLSVDNLFVFLVIFRYFKTPEHLLHKVLFWGVLGAIVMRAIFIFAGLALIHQFAWILYLLGGFLIFTGLRLAFGKEHEFNPKGNIALAVLRRCLPITEDYRAGHFFVRERRRWLATPLFVVLLVVETTDVLFAVDSIPAVMAITTDPFIVYTSNLFAILGLRSLYFLLSSMMDKFIYLRHGLAAILVLIGVKMLLADWGKLPIGWTLGAVAAILTVSIVLSWRHSAASR